MADDLAASVGNPAPPSRCSSAHRRPRAAAAGQVIALVVLADGADVLLFRTTDAVAAGRRTGRVADQVAAGPRRSPYGTFLRWRGCHPVEPPRRRPPVRAVGVGRRPATRTGSSASSARPTSPATCTSRRSGPATPLPMADATGTIATFTVDRLAYSPSPPIVFAVVDFDGGGRLPVELTDVDEAEVAIGMRVEMTFRRLFTADGIHNYFWKARPHLMGSATGSRTGSPSSGWAAPASPSTGTRARRPAPRRHRRGVRRRPASAKDDVDAYWLGTAQVGMSGMLLAKPLGCEGKPVTRVENICATGSEALRQAAYAVASGPTTSPWPSASRR